MVLHYIEQFGPITLDDLSWWLPLTKTRSSEVLTEHLREQISPVEFEGRCHWMEKADFERFLSFEEESEGPIVNLLPYEDHFSKSYTLRHWFLKPEVQRLVEFEGKMYVGQIQPSIWIDGNIVGRWIWEWENRDRSSGRARTAQLAEPIQKKKALMKLISTRLDELTSFMNDRMAPLINRR
jgi:hypothetical protein